MKRAVTVGIAALMIAAVTARAETVSGTVRGADRVYTFVADTGQSAHVTAMWPKRSSDLDIFVFFLDAEEPILVVASEATGERLESTKWGVLPDGLYSVVLSRFAGGSTKFTMNVATAGSELVSAASFEVAGGGQLRFAGDLDSLAGSDPYFARMRETVSAMRELKARHR